MHKGKVLIKVPVKKPGNAFDFLSSLRLAGEHAGGIKCQLGQKDLGGAPA